MDNSSSNRERDKIASRLKEARVISGLSQAQAADKLGLQRPTISEIEAGKRKVGAEELLQFADLYRVDTSWLLLLDDENDPHLSGQLKLAARELSKMSPEDREKLLRILKILPK